MLTTYTYDRANRLQTANAGGVVTTYTHDPAGNRTSVQTPTDLVSYAWDAGGRMATADPVAGTVTFTYDADGRRVAKQGTDGSVTGYLYDYKKLLAETDEVGGDVATLYSTTADGEYGDLIGEDEGFTHQYDAEANTNALLDASGMAEVTYKYYAFGNVASFSVEGDAWQSLTAAQWGTLTADGWAGLPVELSTRMLAGGKKQYYFDSETELYLLGTGNGSGGGRYYDATAGRFVSEDVKRQGAGNPNLFGYVENNPVNRLDPGGQESQTEDEARRQRELADQQRKAEAGRPPPQYDDPDKPGYVPGGKPADQEPAAGQGPTPPEPASKPEAPPPPPEAPKAGGTPDDEPPKRVPPPLLPPGPSPRPKPNTSPPIPPQTSASRGSDAITVGHSTFWDEQTKLEGMFTDTPETSSPWLEYGVSLIHQLDDLRSRADYDKSQGGVNTDYIRKEKQRVLGEIDSLNRMGSGDSQSAPTNVPTATASASSTPVESKTQLQLARRSILLGSAAERQEHLELSARRERWPGWENSEHLNSAEEARYRILAVKLGHKDGWEFEPVTRAMHERNAYLDEKYGSGISWSTPMRLLDQLMNPAWNGTGNINDWAIVLGGPALTYRDAARPAPVETPNQLPLTQRGSIAGDRATMQQKVRQAREGNLDAIAELQVAKWLRAHGAKVEFVKANSQSRTPEFRVNDAFNVEVKFVSGIGSNAVGQVARGVDQAKPIGVVYVVRSTNSKTPFEKYTESLLPPTNPNPTYGGRGFTPKVPEVRVKILDQHLIQD